ncbi:MAG TPA: PVC-type heme-binding CxxCH protein, partial [Verrucomicrobiae bacterium]|nr:PVC-type heme-binding CxxCH protein [Verrucomicrobiae bacterium]
MRPRLFFALALLVICLFGRVTGQNNAASLQLHTRSRAESKPGAGDWKIVEKDVAWDPRKTAIIICDMWDQHWCKGATRRVGEMAPRMNEVIKEARKRGVQIIHAPSDTMKFYALNPQRLKASQVPKARPPADVNKWKSLNMEKEGPLPIDDSDGGCDDEPRCPQGNPWKREIATLEVFDQDYITDNGEEVYNILAKHGIDNVIVMGVHANMCVLGRPFSIRQMVSLGKNVLLMRDMTDTMYNSRSKPYVSHFAGTDLIVEHIEKHWCGSITSADFLGGQPFHFKEDQRPNICFIIGENEYHTWETLPEFATNSLAWRGLQLSFVTSSTNTADNEFNNYSAIKDADLLVLSTRRRAPPKPMMALIRQHLGAGKPLVGIRTASHAFGTKPKDDQHEGWETFDIDVLGANYQNHYGAGPNTLASLVPEAATHPILTGVPKDGFRSTSHLYKIKKTGSTVTPLLMGQMEGRPETEMLAWAYTADNRRVFYTTLGSPDDFKIPAFRRLLLNGILWALNRPVPPATVTQAANVTTSAAVAQATPAKGMHEPPFSPAESAKMFHVPDDLEIEQVLAEPLVTQPVFLNFDERGRMWVVQYRQYPFPAGLKMLSRDNVWRAVYNKIPPPPPNQFRGEDKITIHEDTDNDGVFDKHTTFVEGLNIATSVARGRGGVWVMNPPYLLFYPDANNDDIPDGNPVVHLAGFGLEDTHSVANSLRWGPDGWLYGCQGSTVTASIVRPGLDQQPIAHTMGQQIWRYQPETGRFEVFSEGGGNAFGLEIDAKGRIFSGHNGGNTRGFYYMQGAYLQKGFEKHGPLSNPYAFGYFPPMPHPDVERFTHNFILYDGYRFPDKYKGKLFGVEPLQGRVVYADIQPDGSSFKTRDLGHVVTSDDTWFKPVDIKAGPDGALYFCDWYDRQVNHYRNHEGQIDKGNGRVYRLKAKGAKPIYGFNLSTFPGTNLVALLDHPNKWYRQEVQRVLADRHDKTLVAPLLKLMRTSTNNQIALEALWAIHASGGWSDDVALLALDHADPFVRAWAARLLGDDNHVSPSLAG